MRSNPKSKKGSENIQHTLTFLFSAAKCLFFSSMVCLCSFLQKIFKRHWEALQNIIAIFWGGENKEFHISSTKIKYLYVYI